MHELAPNVYWTAPDDATDRPVLAAVAGAEATLMVDAGNSVTHAREFLDALAARPVPMVRSVVLTHSHWDHVFGATAIDAVVIASEDTARRLATMATYAWTDAALDERVEAGLEIAFCRDMMKAELSAADRAELTVRLPDRTFRDEMSVDLGGVSVRLLHVGGDHAPDSSIVIVPGIAAFLGDCVYRNLHAEPNYLTRRQLLPLLERLLALDVRYFVLGHEDAPLTRTAFEEMATELTRIGIAIGANDGAASLPPDHDPSIAESFRAGRSREVDALQDLDVEYARFNSAKTVGDARPSRFDAVTVGPLTVTVDPARDTSYYNRVLGVDAKTLPSLDAALEHLVGRTAVQVDIDEPVDAAVAEALRERRFVADHRLEWLVAPAVGAAPGERVTRLGADDRERVRAVLEIGGPIRDEVWSQRRELLCTDTFRFFGIDVNGELVAIATTFLGQHGAILGNAFTREAYRGRGFHTALLTARLADAAALGIASVVTDVEPNTTSLRNCERAAFSPLCVQTQWTRQESRSS